MCSSVEDWLRSLGLIHYTQAFLDNGYDELEICKEMGREDLDAIGVTNIKDRNDILNDVARLKQSGTAVYFVLEGSDNIAVPNVQPQRETYPPVKLKMMLHDKLEEDKINLAGPPYTRSDGSTGSLDALVTLYADKFFTYEKDVWTALLSLRQRQTRSDSVCENTLPQIVAPPVPSRTVPGGSPSYMVKQEHSQDEEKQDYNSRHSDSSKDECQWMSVTKDEQTSPNTLLPDYLDVDSPGNRGGKVKKRRKVERNTKLSRSLDSLKELHVNNVDAKPRNREPSSFKGKSFPLKWFPGSKKKHPSHERKKQVLEKKTSGHGNKDYHLLASAIKMSEEDRKTLMIMVKQGDLTVEEAVEQLKRYEEDCRPREDSVSKGDLSNDEDKMGSKPKLKRGIFGKSSKRKSVSRPTSEFIACEMIMSEEDRINLMTSVKNGDMSVDQALKRFISYEEKHKKSDSDDSTVATKPSHYMKESPKIQKGSGFSRISIKRVSGVLSSSLKLSQNTNEPNSVFYTATDDGASVDGSASSGDEALGTVDSSPGPSPKRLLSGAQDSSKSQHSSTSSVESVDRLSERSETSPADKKPLTFLSEMKVTLASSHRGVELDGAKGQEINQGVASLPVKQELKEIPMCGKYDISHPSQSDRKRSLPCLESQKVTLAPNPTGSLKRIPPNIPPRTVPTGVFPHRPPPPIPLRSKSGSTEEKSSGGEGGETEAKIHVKNKPLTGGIEAVTRSSEIERQKSSEVKTGESYSRENETRIESNPPEHHVRDLKPNIKGTAKPKPPPLPPRPPSSASSSSSLNDEIQIAEARSVETQTSPPWVSHPVRKGSLTTAPSDEVLKGAQGPSPPAEHSSKPLIKPKPRPKPRMKMTATQDKEIEAAYTSPGESYHHEPPPHPVSKASLGTQYHKLPPPRLVDEASAGTPYHKVPSPRPVDRASPGEEHKGLRPASVEELLLDETYDAVPTPRSLDGSRTRGESSGSSAVVNIERDGMAPSLPQRPAPDRQEDRDRSEELEEASRRQSLPVPAPRAKRASHSLGEMVERKLYVEKIDLAAEPYSDKSGCWGVPVNLVDRYSEELRRSHEELAGIMDKIRIRKLKQAGRMAIPCNVTELEFTRDPLGYLGSLDEWLTSLGLPMYIDGLREVEYDDMDMMPYMEERHFQYAGIGDPRHMRRLVESVERMPR